MAGPATLENPPKQNQRSNAPPDARSGPPAPPTPPKPPRRRLAFRIIGGVLVLIVLGILIWKLFFAAPKVPANLVVLSGRIEGDDSAVAPKTAGKITEIRFREGDSVKAGDVIATLDDEQVRAREEQARAALQSATARESAARSQLAMLQEQLRQSGLQTVQSRQDAAGRVKQSEAELAASEAELAQQEASLSLAQFDRDAYTKLAATGAVSERQGKQAVATAEQQAAVVAASRRRVDAARGALTAARANLENPNIRATQELIVKQQIAQQQAEIGSSVASAQQARFQLQEAQANRNDLTITAPFDGTIITRAAEPGEVVTAGTAIVTLLDLSKVYLRGFIPEGEIGRVKIGQPARIYLDSNPDQPIDAFVARADPQATFTPENIYFRNERVKQVIGVKLQIKSGVGLAKPGMPADGEILVSGDQWPKYGRPQ